jgi:DNA gyrase/topoisomerase IV subunit B
VPYVLSARLLEPQFSGQTKERLSSRQCAVFISGVGEGFLQPVAQPAHGEAASSWPNFCDRQCATAG